MESNVITKEDLIEFRTLLLLDLRKIVELMPVAPQKPWLKNSEVKKLLNISSNTIQRLKVTGKLRSSKVGGIHFYRYEDIEKLMNNVADSNEWKR